LQVVTRMVLPANEKSLTPEVAAGVVSYTKSQVQSKGRNVTTTLAFLRARDATFPRFLLEVFMPAIVSSYALYSSLPFLRPPPMASPCPCIRAMAGSSL